MHIALFLARNANFPTMPGTNMQKGRLKYLRLSYIQNMELYCL